MTLYFREMSARVLVRRGENIIVQTFTNVVKPTHICNISCKYCYNEDTRAPIMTRETLKRVIAETFGMGQQREVPRHFDFIWHGGEPLVAGKKFYKEVFELQGAYANGQKYENTFQTNGLLIDDEWAAIIKDNDARLSISIDGPAHLNDRTRVDHRGRGTFDRIRKAFDVVRKAEIPFGVCVVITRKNMDSMDALWDFLSTEKLPFNIIPLTRSGSACGAFEDLGLGPEEYSKPWIDLYDKWFDAADDYVYCSDFSFKTMSILNARPADCIGQANCSFHHVSTDPDGFVYPCATLSGDQYWSYGNINELTMDQLLSSTAAKRAKGREMDPHCLECKWKNVCHGGCMQRAFKFFGNINTRDYYCESLYKMYDHVEERLRDDATMNLSNLPPANFTDNRRAPILRPIKV